eukprot:gb/GECH01010122.1/.p1 GENE.gb/GECH01010122.1/~~gb/GECH01010122.1/.p1  ORF type:complete len:382 (+),score=24.16 gb/GECH01010122.1/:1-1146(+)
MALLLWIIGGYTCGIGAILYIMLFGQSKFHQGGIGERLHDRLTSCPSAFMQKVGTPCCGAQGVDSFVQWIFYSPHPLIQIFYLTLLTVGLGVYMILVWPLLGEYGFQLHQITTLFVPIAAYTTFLVACVSDPGVVTQTNITDYRHIYSFDYLLHVPKYCKTNRITRPPRAKTCRVCGHTVARFDHHCAWINNDVGLKNHRWFMLFLITNLLMCIYGTVLLGALVVRIVRQHDLLTATFIVGGRRRSGSLGVVVQYVFYRHTAVVVLLFLMLACGVMLSLFIGYHLYLISRNTTTNETFRWSVVRDDIQCLRSDLEEAESLEMSAIDNQDVHVLQEDVARQHRNLLHIARSGTTHIPNPYDKGIWGNFAEIICPPVNKIKTD